MPLFADADCAAFVPNDQTKPVNNRLKSQLVTLCLTVDTVTWVFMHFTLPLTSTAEFHSENQSTESSSRYRPELSRRAGKVMPVASYKCNGFQLPQEWATKGG
jgi:hypothetical protein